MKSIRRSLLAYLMGLLTLVLALVSVLVYQTTAQALHERQDDIHAAIRTQFASRSNQVRAELDVRILRQAQTMANLARTTHLHFESLYPLGAIGAGALPNSHLNIVLWLAQGTNPYLAGKLIGMRPQEILVDNADDLVPPENSSQPREYFQTYRDKGRPQQTSPGLAEHAFTLDPVLRDHTELLKERFDDVELADGRHLRRVTLKASVPGVRSVSLPWMWGKFTGGGPGGPGGGPGGPKGGPPPIRWNSTGGGFGPSRHGTFNFGAPVVFIQYASDLSHVEAKIDELREERDTQIQQLDSEIQADLGRLRSRLFVISAFTLVGIGLGSYLLVLLGLVPLQQMSHAVSQISEKDFKLNVDPAKLPQELQPIANRLTQMLDQLRHAFEREKQAAADISHELRTPLSALLTTIEVALKRPRKVEEYQEILDECRSSGRHMYQLVERLLALARLDAGVVHFKPREVDLAEVAKQCVDMIRPLAEARGLKLSVRIEHPVAFTTDPDKVREVLINLLHNAIEYNRPNGTVELFIGSRDNGDLRLEVRDTGIGIAAEAKQHLFERFYRADPSRHADTPHAGLGLAIVKSYVDLMGGRIGVDSTDQGSTFFIDLPAPSRA